MTPKQALQMLRDRGGELGRQAAEHIEHLEQWLQSETKLVQYYANLLAAAREALARQVRIVDELKRGRVITWWRGNDAGVAGTVQVLNERLDHPPREAGVFGYKPLQQLWERIRAAQVATPLDVYERQELLQARLQELVLSQRVAGLEKELDEAQGTVKEKIENCCALKTRIADLEGDLCVTRQWSAHRVAELEDQAAEQSRNEGLRAQRLVDRVKELTETLNEWKQNERKDTPQPDCGDDICDRSPQGGAK